ncbi:MAG TPA: hypothetical protein VLI90_06990, partial [Tepidisphaeraceae bacterium]|nr:hypothetical protein [Tepidisphaeraceae bacterium]
ITTTAHADGDLSNVLGVAHADGKYFLTDGDYLNEGADQVAASGSKVLKLWFNPVRYPWNSHWPDKVPAMVDLAQTPYYRAVFAKPFSTIILVAYSFGRDEHYFVNGVTDDQLADETRQFHDLTAYLLTTYRGSGKTFVLQHWEGDWALRDDHTGHIYDDKVTPTQKAIDSMIRWINARQAGISQARAEVKDSDVHVYGACEANRVEDSMAGRPGVANSVLPHTTVDLASYSSYVSLTSPDRLSKAVDYLAGQLPPTAAFGQNPHSIYLGEFGYPENGDLGAAGVNDRINTVVQVVKAKQLPYAILWQTYCNEIKKDVTAAPPLNGPGNNDKFKGYWLVKPDGKPSVAWHRYRQLIITSDDSRATASAIKAKLSPVFHDGFARPDGADIGPGWTQSAHYGPIGGHLANHQLQLDIADGTTIQWTSDTLDLTNDKILGRGMNVGEYFEVKMQRHANRGMCGVELFDSDQLRQGSAMPDTPAPLHAWDGTTWTPLSIDAKGQPVAIDWNQPHTLGVRFDSADGHFDTFSYYIDNTYAGSWLVKTGNRTLDKIGVFAQSDLSGASFTFAGLTVYGRGK